jgi:CMP-N-acetylneuraminic acid synthetase
MSGALDQIVVSTDDEEIAQASIQLGASIPFMRPSELATDEASSLSVVQHALKFLKERGAHFKGVVLLQPTSPFRSALDIQASVRVALKCKSDGLKNVVSVTQHSHDPRWSFSIDNTGSLQKLFDHTPSSRRQDAPRSYYPNGAVFVTSTANVMAGLDWYHGAVMPHVMPPSRSMDIDTPRDLELARAQVKLLPGLSDLEH